jgi:hypothetical protein
MRPYSLLSDAEDGSCQNGLIFDILKVIRLSININVKDFNHEMEEKMSLVR